MSIGIYTHLNGCKAEIKAGDHGNLEIGGGDLAPVSVHGFPRHVVEAIVAAFDRAMQVVKRDDGAFSYRTDAGDWTISLDSAMGKVWHFQNEEVTGDGDPNWLHGTAASLMGALDEIDALIEEHKCDECNGMTGLDNLVELHKPHQMVCSDCFDAIAEREAAMVEADWDDKSRAKREEAMS